MGIGPHAASQTWPLTACWRSCVTHGAVVGGDSHVAAKSLVLILQEDVLLGAAPDEDHGLDKGVLGEEECCGAAVSSCHENGFGRKRGEWASQRTDYVQFPSWRDGGELSCPFAHDFVQNTKPILFHVEDGEGTAQDAVAEVRYLDMDELAGKGVLRYGLHLELCTEVVSLDARVLKKGGFDLRFW